MIPEKELNDTNHKLLKKSIVLHKKITKNSDDNMCLTVDLLDLSN